MAPSRTQNLRCSICRRPVPPRAENPGFPFCSSRCKAVDLGKWLGEEYRVANRHAEESEDEGEVSGEGGEGGQNAGREAPGGS